jgi:hypothetical protein
MNRIHCQTDQIHIPGKTMTIEKRISWFAKTASSLWPLVAPLFLCWQAAAAGTWVPLNPLGQAPPAGVNLMILLSDGTVLAAGRVPAPSWPPDFPSRQWYRLNPTPGGHYVGGLWKLASAMHDTRLYYSSAVLRDGRVLVAGAEYGDGGNTSEMYNPVSDTWTRISVPASLLKPNTQRGFSDSGSVILSNGNVLVAPVNPSTPNMTVIYDVIANTWSAGPINIGSQNEASWVKLPDDSILTVDKDGITAERYIPSLNSWVADSTVPASLFSRGWHRDRGGVVAAQWKSSFPGWHWKDGPLYALRQREPRQLDTWPGHP